MYNSTNNTAIYGRKSSHEAEIGRHGISCCTELGAFVARTGFVVAIGASEGMISYRIIDTITRVTGGRISSRNGGTHRSLYASQRAIQTS